jgi:hypothetical protein
MTLRENIVSHALWGVANEPQIHYSQGPRRFAALATPRALPLYTDCSAFVTLCYAWAGAPDPNGLDYSGQGFTGTQLDHLEHIALADALPGDPVVFGPGSGEHVVMLIEPGSNHDPMCVSHGQEAGPIKVRLSVEIRAHHAPVTVLRGEGLDDTPEPQHDEDEDMTDEMRRRFDAIDVELKDIRNQIGESHKRADGSYEDTGLAGAIHKVRVDIKALAVDVPDAPAAGPVRD